MTPGQLLRQAEFTPVPSHDSVFVYMIPPQNVMSHWHEITPGVEPWREFHSGAKFWNGIMLMRNDHLFQCEIGLLVDWNG